MTRRLKIEEGFLWCNAFHRDWEAVDHVSICSGKEAYGEFKEEYKKDIKNYDDETTSLFVQDDFYTYTQEDFNKLGLDEPEVCYSEYIESGNLPFFNREITDFHGNDFPVPTSTFKHIWVSFYRREGSMVMDNLSVEEKLILLEYLKIQVENKSENIYM